MRTGTLVGFDLTMISASLVLGGLASGSLIVNGAETICPDSIDGLSSCAVSEAPRYAALRPGAPRACCVRRAFLLLPRSSSGLAARRAPAPHRLALASSLFGRTRDSSPERSRSRSGLASAPCWVRLAGRLPPLAGLRFLS